MSRDSTFTSSSIVRAEGIFRFEVDFEAGADLLFMQPFLDGAEDVVVTTMQIDERLGAVVGSHCLERHGPCSRGLRRVFDDLHDFSISLTSLSTSAAWPRGFMSWSAWRTALHGDR